MKIPKRLRFVLSVLMLGTLSLTGAHLRGAPFVRGDVDQNGSLEITDAIQILLDLFVDGTPIRCRDAADVNDSGRVDISDAVYELSFLFLGGLPPAIPYPDCGEDPTEDITGCDTYPAVFCQESPSPTGGLVRSTGCKMFEKGDVGPDLACVTYTYTGTTLALQHINAGFNCCPDEIVVTVSVEGDEIIIHESEVGGLCDCLCLYDLDIEIRDLPAGAYRVRVENSYVRDPDPELAFSIDVPGTPEGMECAERTYYPWGGE